MGLRIVPGSIRGKLILAFLIAVAPVAGVQICNDIDDIMLVRKLCADRERAVATSIANAISLDINQLKDRHYQFAGRLTKRAITAQSARQACRTFDEISCSGSQSNLDTSAPVNRNARTNIFYVVPKYGGLARFELRTPVQSQDKAYSLVTRVPINTLLNNIPDDYNCGWRLQPESGAELWGIGRRIMNKKTTAPAKIIVCGNGAICCEMSPLGKDKCIGAIAGVPGTNWKLMVMDLSRRAMIPANRQWKWFAASLAAIICGLIGTFWISSKLGRPIRRLAHAASAIAVGDYGRRVNLKTGDELQTLGESFNALGSSLAAREAALRKQTEMVAGMAEASQVASSSLNLRECGRAIAKVLCTHIGASDAAVFRKDATNGGMKTIGRSGRCQRAVWKRLASHSADSGGYLVICEQIAESGNYDSQDAYLVGVPLTVGPVALGAIVARFEGDIDKKDLQHGSSQADLLTAFGVHAAAAIRNAEAFSQTERYSEVLEDWVEHLSGVMQVTNAISPSLNLQETLAALARATADVFSADSCAIYLPDRTGKLIIQSNFNMNSELAAKVRIKPGQSETGKAFEEKHYRTCIDATESLDPVTRKLAEQMGTRGLLSSPLVVEDRAIGVITIYSEKPREFTAQEIRLLISIGLHAAVIVRNAGLYTREASIAETLQKGLVPDVPDTCRGLAFAGRYVPALDEARVGGDFYDVAELPNGCVGVVIGDVSGKGLKAAIHLATCKYMLKSLMYTYPDDPGLVLSRLNDAFNHYFDLSFFVTVFYAVVDPNRGVIYYANAGHPPALLISQGGKMQTCLTATGTPVGSGEPSAHEARCVKISKSDLLLLYTDGVSDTIADDTLLGIDNLQRMLFEARNCSAAQLIEWMCERLNQDANNTTLKDDMALLAVSFEGVGMTPQLLDGGSDESEYRLAARTA